MMKILLTYSSGYGATFEISQAIKDILSSEREFSLDFIPIDAVEDISQYDTVIVGSSVRADKPLANTRDFFAKNHPLLAQKSIAFFLVCLSAATPEGREKALTQYASAIFSKYPHIHPIAIEAFAGKIDFDRLNPVMKNLVSYVIQKLDVPAEGSIDARDWTRIRQWAQHLSALLKKKDKYSLVDSVNNMESSPGIGILLSMLVVFISCLARL